ncbi:unnamed protein product [Amoebophrya sp. A25]|nr:unnamed protein product [Amoebophrya sp. A25]|eukprot:GSA25T00000304001.1
MVSLARTRWRRTYSQARSSNIRLLILFLSSGSDLLRFRIRCRHRVPCQITGSDLCLSSTTYDLDLISANLVLVMCILGHTFWSVMLRPSRRGILHL